MKFKAYLIECITNLHVGSGDANYGIIDNLVQRDSVSSYPTIHSSSLKGALREHFIKKYKDGDLVKEVFGEDGNDSKTGSYKFLVADLYAMPIRCTYQNYVLGLNKMNIATINNKANLLIDKAVCQEPSDANSIFANSDSSDIYAEEFKLNINNAQNNFNVIPGLHNFASFDENTFENLMRHLPVIARNRLGENKNLWYEEVVPHKTLFVTFIGTNNENATFETDIKSDIFQIGANSSIGYGLTKFHNF
jgi:CRISPR-associated protein Cmr4